jgi:NAD(P)H-hydrate epimerase
MTDGVQNKIADLLQKVGEIHHMVFADTDGADDDWATFYSDWLLTHSDLPKLLSRRPVRSHLTRDLVELDEQYVKLAPTTPWPAWYAERLIAKYNGV